MKWYRAHLVTMQTKHQFIAEGLLYRVNISIFINQMIKNDLLDLEEENFDLEVIC